MRGRLAVAELSRSAGSAERPGPVAASGRSGEVDEDELRWEIRSQITETINVVESETNAFGVKKLQPGQVAATVYKGPYEKIEETFIALRNWISDNGYEINGPYEELFLNSSSKPEELLTELRFPIRKKGRS